MNCTFMMSSDLNIPTPAILIPAFAVPYAAPMATISHDNGQSHYRRISSISSAKIPVRCEEHTAAATPPNPMNGARIVGQIFT
jgi:hypothetical protein